MAEHDKALAHQFDDMEQQYLASTTAMWIFLATEVMFFGGLFTGYMVYRAQYTEAWVLGSRQLSFASGTAMTAILLVSSFTMAMGVRSAQLGEARAQRVYLMLTIVLGAAFLGIKGMEYAEKFHENLVPGASFHWEGPLARNVELFISFYFAMTALHALHMIIGIGLVAWLIVKSYGEPYRPSYYTPVDVTGLYWHFVDIIWIYLYPLLYLVDRHK